MSNSVSRLLLRDGSTATVHSPNNSSAGVVFYLHGGGLIFGDHDDLPTPYIEAFTAAGLSVVALPYPCAPSIRAEGILSTLEAHLAELEPQLADSHGMRVLFGRSAGAFLALQLQARAQRNGASLADRLIVLYGYADMRDEGFHTPSAHYLGFGEMPGTTDNPAPDDLAARFSLYVRLRQRGAWPEAMLDSDVRIEDDELAQFPPTFLAASVYDPDVPFRCSERLAACIPEAILHRIDDVAEHDIDRNPADPYGLALYREMIAWLQAP